MKYIAVLLLAVMSVFVTVLEFVFNIFYQPYKAFRKNFRLGLSFMPEPARKKMPRFADSNGLYHHIDHLRELSQDPAKMHGLVTLPLERLSLYADEVCIKSDEESMDYMMQGISEIVEAGSMEEQSIYVNATTMGNLAHIALHYSEPHKSTALRALAFFKYHFRQS